MSTDNEDECSSRDNLNAGNCKSSAQPSVRVSPQLNRVKVLGQQNFQGPSVIKSILDKVDLKKEGSVCALKRVQTESKAETKIKRVFRCLPTVNDRFKGKLVSVIRGKATDQEDLSKIPKKNLEETAEKQKRRECTCNEHCRCLRKREVITGPPHTFVKMDGDSLTGDLEQQLSDDSAFDVENIFTVSTLLTNVNDQSQLEVLCQLLLESLFKLKDANQSGTMSKLVVYLSQGQKERSRSPQCRPSKYNPSQDIPVQDSPQQDSPQQGSPQQDNPSQDTQPLPQNVLEPIISLSIVNDASHPLLGQTEEDAHDPSYLSPDPQVLFHKPPYLVNLLNIETYEASNRNKKMIKSPPMKSLINCRINLLRQHRQISRLKEFLRERNEKIRRMEDMINQLGICIYQEDVLDQMECQNNPQFILIDENEIEKAVNDINHLDAQKPVEEQGQHTHGLCVPNSFGTHKPVEGQGRRKKRKQELIPMSDIDSPPPFP